MSANTGFVDFHVPSVAKPCSIWYKISGCWPPKNTPSFDPPWWPWFYAWLPVKSGGPHQPPLELVFDFLRSTRVRKINPSPGEISRSGLLDRTVVPWSGYSCDQAFECSRWLQHVRTLVGWNAGVILRSKESPRTQELGPSQHTRKWWALAFGI